MRDWKCRKSRNFPSVGFQSGHFETQIWGGRWDPFRIMRSGSLKKQMSKTTLISTHGLTFSSAGGLVYTEGWLSSVSAVGTTLRFRIARSVRAAFSYPGECRLWLFACGNAASRTFDFHSGKAYSLFRTRNFRTTQRPRRGAGFGFEFAFLLKLS